MLTEQANRHLLALHPFAQWCGFSMAVMIKQAVKTSKPNSDKAVKPIIFQPVEGSPRKRKTPRGRGCEAATWPEYVLRFTRADVFVALWLGWRDHAGWHTRRCSMGESALRPCALLAAFFCTNNKLTFAQI